MSFAYNDTGTQLKFNPGDKWEARRVIIALDQPGRGQGDLLAIDQKGNFYNIVTRGQGWPHQALEPVYCWNNSLNGKLNDPVATVHSGYPTVQENHDYYNYKADFDGAVGVGSGKLADRPKICTPGVGYWATDQGPQGTLFVCGAKNAWVEYYKPYVYPHPLVGGEVKTATARVGRSGEGKKERVQN